MQEIEKNKLTIPIYLNTKIVFDMLATIEDGFAEVKNVQTSKSKNRENDIETNIGSNNLFAFLNVGIHGNHKVIQVMERLSLKKEHILLFLCFRS